MFLAACTKEPAYCSLVEDLAFEEGRFNAAEFASSDGASPAEIRRYATEAAQMFERLVALAPATIEADVRTLAGAARRTLDDVAKVGFRFDQLPDPSPAEEERVRGARSRFDAYNKTACPNLPTPRSS